MTQTTMSHLNCSLISSNLNSSNNEFNKLALLRYSIKIDIDISTNIKKQATQLWLNDDSLLINSTELRPIYRIKEKQYY